MSTTDCGEMRAHFAHDYDIDRGSDGTVRSWLYCSGNLLPADPVATAEAECPMSRHYPPKSFDGHCPSCGARVGANRHDKIKVHKVGVDTRVITTGKMADY